MSVIMVLIKPDEWDRSQICFLASTIVTELARKTRQLLWFYRKHWVSWSHWFISTVVFLLLTTVTHPRDGIDSLIVERWLNCWLLRLRSRKSYITEGEKLSLKLHLTSGQVHPKNYACRVALCWVLLWFSTDRLYPNPSGLLHWHWGNHMIAPVSVM